MRPHARLMEVPTQIADCVTQQRRGSGPALCSDERRTWQVHHAQSRFSLRCVPHADSGQPRAAGFELAGFRDRVRRLLPLCFGLRCKDCSLVRGYPYKRSHLVALRAARISAHDPQSTWWPGERRHYFGGCSSGDRSHSLMCEPVSAWRAFRRRVSRAAPGGSVLAFSRRRFASSARRSSRDWICFTRRRSMDRSLVLAGPNPHGSA
jgi:hypothetical protein